MFSPLSFFLRLVTFAVLYNGTLAADPTFVNPPSSNVVVSSQSFPVYATGSSILVSWTSNSSYEPLNIVLRAIQDGILTPSSGVDETILSTLIILTDTNS